MSWAAVRDDRGRVGWVRHTLLEAGLVLLAVIALLPGFERVASLEGRGERYAAVALHATSPRTEDSRAFAGSTHPAIAAKNEAMLALLPVAGWQWFAGVLIAWSFLQLSRTRLPVAWGLGLAMLGWAAAAWAARVPWPLASGTSFETGRASGTLFSQPATFVLVLGAAGAMVLLAAILMRTGARKAHAVPGSALAFPGFVAAIGVGWGLLLDLSAHGPPTNRYLGLYHQGHLWLALLAFSLFVFLRPTLARLVAVALALVEELGSRIGRAMGAAWSTALLGVLAALAALAAASLLAGARQVTSELGRVWLIVGAAWFFFLRGAPLARRLARQGAPLASLLRYVWPLAFVTLVLVAVMFSTRDMGPLLIACYAAGAFVAATVALFWHVRSGWMAAPAVLAMVLFAAWIAAITQALFAFGAIDDVTAARLENLAAPLASVNDQLALVTWFRAAAPPEGFGIGAIPWCGYASATGCAGVPAQIQSDYTFTALVGAFGEAVTWTFTLGAAVWLHAIVRRHGTLTRGEPRLVRSGARLAADRQALTSWMGVTWVVLTLCQLAVTVAGNLAVLPLTGVTYPFVSFGMTSLVVNTALLALCVDLEQPEALDG